MKNTYKTALAIGGLNLIENLTLLYFFGVSITKQTLIGVFVFTILLTLLLKTLKIINND